MSEFFRNGGVGMYPVLLLGSLAVAAAVLWAIRLERRHLRLMLALAVTSVAAGLLALSMGLINADCLRGFLALKRSLELEEDGPSPSPASSPQSKTEPSEGTLLKGGSGTTTTTLKPVTPPVPVPGQPPAPPE